MVAWIVTTVLAVGEALVEQVPIPRLESVRSRVRAELKAAVGRSVLTSKVGLRALWVWSGVVAGAKTPERWQPELREDVDRMDAIDHGRPVEPARWCRT